MNDSLSAFAKRETDSPQPIDACTLHARESQLLQPDEIERLKAQRNEWMNAALAHEQIAAELRMRLMEMPEPLTDAERTCLGYAIRKMDAEYAAGPADVLRGLLKRTDPA